MPRHEELTVDVGTVLRAQNFHEESQAEFEALRDAVCARLRRGALPPDDAYWWARILASEAAARLRRQDELQLASGTPGSDNAQAA